MDSSGFLIRTLYDEDPVFKGFNEQEILTASQTDEFVVYYGKQTPYDGDVLAATVESSVRHPTQKSFLHWQVGEGRVLGIGHGLHSPSDDSYSPARSQLFGNALSYLAGEGEVLPTMGRPNVITSKDPSTDKTHIVSVQDSDWEIDRVSQGMENKSLRREALDHLSIIVLRYKILITLSSSSSFCVNGSPSRVSYSTNRPTRRRADRE